MVRSRGGTRGPKLIGCNAIVVECHNVLFKDDQRLKSDFTRGTDQARLVVGFGERIFPLNWASQQNSNKGMQLD